MQFLRLSSDHRNKSKMSARIRVLLHGKIIIPLKNLVQREIIISGPSSERENLPSNESDELTSLRAENTTHNSKLYMHLTELPSSIRCRFTSKGSIKQGKFRGINENVMRRK